jgi:hypothetical protein
MAANREREKVRLLSSQWHIELAWTPLKLASGDRHMGGKLGL